MLTRFDDGFHKSKQPAKAGFADVDAVSTARIPFTGRNMPTRNDCLTYIREAYDNERGQLDREIAAWQEQFRANAAFNALFGYSPPRWPLHLAAVAAFLYEQSADPALAAEAADLFLRFPGWTQELPREIAAARPEYADGVPPLDTTFDPLVFGAACARIRSALPDAKYAALADIAAASLRPIWRFPEWGGHNRALLRAASLAVCARAFPHHPDTPAWAEMADELAEESWGRWSIEDALMYQAHWLRAMIVYATARDRAAQLAHFVQPRLYLRAAAQLMSPLGVLPDFGDSHWQTHGRWEWLACLEWGAATYRDPAMKWAAAQLWDGQPRGKPNLYGAQALLLAWSWCDDAMPARPPDPDDDALDDLVQKKIAFRTGWNADATYACLNYRDEGDYARVARDYLRQTLAVSAEKMHHGHADEGSFSLLVHGGTVLLHESGYRESPPDGMYRADVYHNRLIWRLGDLPAEKSLAGLFDSGAYRPVRTERIYRTRLGDAEIARVRVTDEAQSIIWDRSVFFLAGLPCWVVIDTARALTEAERTFALLWWTTDILAQNHDWADTHIAEIQGWPNQHNATLRVITPAVPGQQVMRSHATFRRCFRDEIMLATHWRGVHRVSEPVHFVTVLWPHPYGEAGGNGPSTEVVRAEPAGRGIAVRLVWQGETRLLATRSEPGAGLLAEDVRPRYTFATRRAEYPPLVTDADFAYLRENSDEQWAGFVNGTRLDVGGETLYEGGSHAMLQEDRTDRPGIPARFRWTSDAAGLKVQG
jgi:hypothetical protein